MGRIRTIKPEFPQSEDIGRLSRDARLLFVQLWTIVDDDGRTRAASRLLASTLYPYDEDATSLIDAWITELEKNKLILRYEVDGSTYLQVCKWRIHQKIDHASVSKLPSPRERSTVPRESSRILAPDLDLGPGPGPRTVDLGAAREPESKVILEPSMAASMLMLKLAISGKWLPGVITDVLKAEGTQGKDLGNVIAAMESAWNEYQAAKTKLEYSVGAEKFFGEGIWRSPPGWPWKDGKAPATTTRRYANSK